MDCSGACVDVTSSVGSCGSCGNACPTPTADCQMADCESSACTSVPDPSLDDGGCFLTGTALDGDCENGACVPIKAACVPNGDFGNFVLLTTSKTIGQTVDTCSCSGNSLVYLPQVGASLSMACSKCLEDGYGDSDCLM